MLDSGVEIIAERLEVDDEAEISKEVAIMLGMLVGGELIAGLGLLNEGYVGLEVKLTSKKLAGEDEGTSLEAAEDKVAVKALFKALSSVVTVGI